MEAKIHKPVLIVIGGPNGSGKTTITSRVLHHEWLEDSIYINPDNIAQKEQRTTFTSSPQHISIIVFPTFVFLFTELSHVVQERARSFCPLPLLYPSASDFQFHSAGDRWFRACGAYM